MARAERAEKEKEPKVAVAVATVVVKVTVDVATVVVDLEKETRLTAHAGGATEMENQASPITLQATKDTMPLSSTAQLPH